MQKDELSWSKRNFLYSADWSNEHILGEFLGLSRRQIRRARADYTIRTYMSRAYEQKTAQELQHFITDVKNGTHHALNDLDESLDKLNRELAKLEPETDTTIDSEDSPSYASTMIASVCIGMILGMFTLFLVPPNYRPGSNMSQNASSAGVMELLTTVQGWVALSPIIYFLLALVAFRLFEKHTETNR